MNQAELDKLRKEIQAISVRSGLYKLLKKELSKKGWWKNRPRGKHQKGKMNQ
jgi:hypothetical protein